jgi:hypothetical protein
MPGITPPRQPRSGKRLKPTAQAVGKDQRKPDPEGGDRKTHDAIETPRY